MVRGLIVTAWAAIGLCAGAQEIHLQAGDGLQWWKGNTHTHTLWSDGDAAPEFVVNWYKEHGYDFLALTDHNILATIDRWIATGEGTRITDGQVEQLRTMFGPDWVEMRGEGDKREMRLKTLPELSERFNEPGSFLMVWGEEITSPSPSVHVNGINVREAMPPQTGGSISFAITKDVGAVAAQSEALGVPMYAHLNHPNWSVGMSAEDILGAKGLQFFEVFNGHGGVRNWGDAERHLLPTDEIWDIMLAVRLANGEPPIRAVATDDAHEYFDSKPGDTSPGRGFCVVLAPELSADALVEAILAGHYYASSGVMLDAIHCDGKSLKIAIRGEEGVTYTTQFIGTPVSADITATPRRDASGAELEGVTGVYDSAVGSVFFESHDLEPSYTFTGEERYVRIKIVSSKDHPNPFRAGDKEMAWLQPIVVTP